MTNDEFDDLWSFMNFYDEAKNRFMYSIGRKEDFLPIPNVIILSAWCAAEWIKKNNKNKKVNKK